MVTSIDELALKLRDKDRQINGNQPGLLGPSHEKIKESLIEHEETAKLFSVVHTDNIFHNPHLYGDSIAENSKIIANAIYPLLKIEDEIDMLFYAAKYHDYGKIMLDQQLFIKREDISRQEFAEIQKHSEYGANMIRNCKYLKDIIGHHHENWDGTGYPNKLKGEAIPIGARVIRIPDSFDAMTHDRKYQKAIPQYQALEIIKKNSGTLFDPELVDIFVPRMIEILNSNMAKKPDNGNGQNKEKPSMLRQ